MANARLWVEAARPKTLVAGVVPVVVGTAASGSFRPWRFAGAMVVAVSIQVGVNFANDYFDAVKGVDLPDRIGPRRLTAMGLVPSRAMLSAMLMAFAIASAAGLALAWAVGWELVIVGGVCLAAALGYSGGPRPYGAAGLGEFFVFVFFGVVATVGSAYVQTESIVPKAVAASLPVGLLATALLVVNNLRDIDTDRRAGKTTLAVKIGRPRTERLYSALLAGAYLLLPPVVVTGGGPRAALPVLSLPLAWRLVRRISTSQGRALVPVLVATARLQLVFGLLLAVGLWI
ncbi:MAG TPA: 1,4-dihydroxy-2-naphthoate polyprenyltransferase [Actinomycetota bacterium]|nr:1,4-dihydroxy-2-naphthoate polyprenyltransferase [Actinomycetota bacterium]